MTESQLQTAMTNGTSPPATSNQTSGGNDISSLINSLDGTSFITSTASLSSTDSSTSASSSSTAPESLAQLMQAIESYLTSAG